jgi:hypothetical protein
MIAPSEEYPPKHTTGGPQIGARFLLIFGVFVDQDERLP